MFATYFSLGLSHILDIQGYDHILFLITLCALYFISNWKEILILVTAFTIGHSLTLALSALDIVIVNPTWVEILIPVTILLTALLNLLVFQKQTVAKFSQYFLALLFGLIHGLGFSNFFKSLLGKEANVLLPLFSFNLGVEIGQVVIVLFILVINTVVVRKLNLRHRYWILILNGLAIVLSLKMILERVPV